MLVLSSSTPVGLCSSVIFAACAREGGFWAYLESAPRELAVSTRSYRLFLRANSFTGEDFVSILGLAIVLMALLLVVSPETELTWSLSATLRGEPPVIPSPGFPTNFS